MNDAYRAVNMLLEHLQQLSAPSIPKLQIETQLIRIKRLLVASSSQEVQESILPVIAKLIENIQETCGSSGGCRHLEEMVQLVHQLAESTSEKVRDEY